MRMPKATAGATRAKFGMISPFSSLAVSAAIPKWAISADNAEMSPATLLARKGGRDTGVEIATLARLVGAKHPQPSWHYPRVVAGMLRPYAPPTSPRH